VRPNKPIQPTPLCGRKIVSIFEGWNHPDSFPDLDWRRG
jgi:hypothetical protein